MPDDVPGAGGAARAPGAGVGAEGPAALYRARCAAGLIEPDPAQEEALAALQHLDAELRRLPPWRGWFGRLVLGEEKPRGLYLWGPVGGGKSMLMDLFFAAAPVERKRRVHFHAFMLEVHDRVERARRAGVRTPLAAAATDIAAEAALLCFDEFQVTDIADAMILERLFVALIQARVVIVATSNRAPDRLYERGLQRERFMPFIHLLEERLDIVALDGGHDWRLARLRGRPVYYTPLDAVASRALDDAFATATAGLLVQPVTLGVKGRTLVVPRAAGGTAWFAFAELCERPLGAVDYLALAERFQTVFIAGIPRLSPRQRDAAHRFHVLIDALYEGRRLLIASAEVPPRQIYEAGDGSFEFERTVSRLIEMQSETYIARRL